MFQKTGTVPIWGDCVPILARGSFSDFVEEDYGRNLKGVE